jgi:hypothetical protein
MWTVDPRYRPELEVDIEIVVEPDDVPGFHYARAMPELEVELLVVDELFDAWFLDDDALLDDCA